MLPATMEDSLGLLFESVNLFGGARNKKVSFSLGIKRDAKKMMIGGSNKTA